MEQKEYSVKEMLEMTLDVIQDIEVPLRYAMQISRPLTQAMENIKACINAIKDTPSEVENNGEGNGI